MLIHFIRQLGSLSRFGLIGNKAALGQTHVAEIGSDQGIGIRFRRSGTGILGTLYAAFIHLLISFLAGFPALIQFLIRQGNAQFFGDLTIGFLLDKAVQHIGLEFLHTGFGAHIIVFAVAIIQSIQVISADIAVILIESSRIFALGNGFTAHRSDLLPALKVIVASLVLF